MVVYNYFRLVIYSVLGWVTNECALCSLGDNLYDLDFLIRLTATPYCLAA